MAKNYVDINANNSSMRGVVLLAHGSRRGNDTGDGLQEIVKRLQSRLGDERVRVVIACLEFIKPDLVQAVCSLVDEGINDITVMPFLLGRGTHLRDDLLLETRRAIIQRPGAQIQAASSFGCDPILAEIVVDRVRAQTVNVNGALGMSKKGVVLVKAGTRSEAEDHAWLFDLCDLVEQGLGDGFAVSAAQSHFGEPFFEDAVRQLVQERDVSSVMVVPYIFFPGLILTRNVLGGVEAVKDNYPHIEFSVTPTIGVNDKLIEATARKILEVWEGDGVTSSVESHF